MASGKPFLCSDHQNYPLNRKALSRGLAGLLLFTLCQPATTTDEPVDETPVVSVINESPEKFNQRMEWWRDAKFGMFIHWGPYAVPAGVHNGEEVEGIGEWIMERSSIPVAEYEEYSRAFNPEQFDADR